MKNSDREFNSRLKKSLLAETIIEEEKKEENTGSSVEIDMNAAFHAEYGEISHEILVSDNETEQA